MTSKTLLIALLALASAAPSYAQDKVKIKTKTKQTSPVRTSAPGPDWSAQYADQVTAATEALNEARKKLYQLLAAE